MQRSLIGRGVELARLRRVFAQKGSAHGALIYGSAGVGKTRLLTELLDLEAAAGRRVVRLVATHSLSEIPLGVVAGWLPQQMSGEQAGHGHEPISFVAALIDRLSVTHGPPMLLGIDDAHLLDRLSATAVQHLVVNGRIDLVVTVRDGAPAPEEVTALWTAGLLERVELGPLGEASLKELVETSLGGPIDTHSLRRLTSLAHGSVFFLRELVRCETECGSLKPADGVWRWDGHLSLDNGTIDVIKTRVQGLSELAQNACGLLAQSEPLAADVLIALTSITAVEECETLGLVNTSANPATGEWVARLAHPLYGEALRTATAPMRARRLRTQLLAELSRRQPPDDLSLLRRAVLRLDADPDPESDGADLVAAARIAGSLFDFVLAERLARAALASGGGFAAQYAMTYAMVRQGHPDTDKALDDLVGVASTDEERVATVGLSASVRFWIQRRIGRARSEIDNVRVTLGPSSALSLEALSACFEFFLGRPNSAVEVAQRVIADPRASGFATSWAAAGATISCAVMGRVDEAVGFARLGEVAALSLGEERIVQLSLGNGEILALGLAGHLDRAQERALHYEAIAAAAPVGDVAATSALFLGQVALWRGDLRTAVSRLRESLAGFAQYDPAQWSDQCRIWLTIALAESDDIPAAAQTLSQLSDVFPAFTALVHLARGRVAAGIGSTTEAFGCVGAAAEEARASGQSAVEVLALHHAVRWGDPGPAQRLEQLALVVPGPRSRLAADHAQALRNKDAMALTRVGARWATIGALSLAADAAAQSSSVHRLAGETTKAHGSATHARELARRAGAYTPAIAALSMEAPLTSREREVATMAARGLSNVDIAQRMVVSTRTVEGHLYLAYAKLGVHQRTELATALGLVS